MNIADSEICFRHSLPSWCSVTSPSDPGEPTFPSRSECPRLHLSLHITETLNQKVEDTVASGLSQRK